MFDTNSVDCNLPRKEISLWMTKRGNEGKPYSFHNLIHHVMYLLGF